IIIVMLDLHTCLCVVSLRPPLLCTLFPYTTLFRSGCVCPCNRAAPRPPRGAISVRAWFGATAGPPVPAPTHAESGRAPLGRRGRDRKSTRLNSSHVKSSYAVFCLKKKK